MEGKGKKHFYLIVIFILFLLPQSVIHAQDVVENLDNDITNLDIGLSITAEDFYYRFADSAATEKIKIDEKKSGFGTFSNGITAMQLQTNVGILIAFLDNDFFVSHIRLNGKPTSLGSPYRGSSLSLLVATMNAVCDPSRLEIASIDSMKGLENLMKDNTFYYGKCIVYHGVSESGDLYGAMVTHKNATIPWK